MTYSNKLDLPGWSADHLPFRIIYTLRVLRPPLRVLVVGLYAIVLANVGTLTDAMIQSVVVWGGLASMILGYCMADLFRGCSPEELDEVTRMGAEHPDIAASIRDLTASGRKVTHADFMFCRRTARDRAWPAPKRQP